MAKIKKYKVGASRAIQVSSNVSTILANYAKKESSFLNFGNSEPTLSYSWFFVYTLIFYKKVVYKKVLLENQDCSIQN